MSTQAKKFIRVSAILMASVALVLGSVGSTWAPAASPPTTEAVNTLRVYGYEQEDAASPYTDYRGPFVISDAELADTSKAPQIPPKDFVVFNPAYLYHGDFPDIKANNYDANEKVHLRMWYVPRLHEPVGKTGFEIPSEKYKNPHIVMEYTYMLLNVRTNDPTHGAAGSTYFRFPMAGLGGQVGLDRYDVNGDGTPETMALEKVWDVAEKTTLGTIAVSTKETVGPLAVPIRIGESMQFLDYQVTVLDILPGDQVQLGIYYIGNRSPDYIGPARLQLDDGVGTPENDTALVEARHGPIYIGTDPWTMTPAPTPIYRPFWVTLEFVGPDYVTLRPHRILTADETFFVDGAEYYVAAILIEDAGDAPAGEPWNSPDEFKYITLRNPLPKEDVKIEEITVEKEGIGADEVIPVLPPFNLPHDMIDDINIPDSLQGDPNNTVYPDEQRPDNCGDPYSCANACGGLDGCYDTIRERWWGDTEPPVDPLRITWIQEKKEPRFDTNLLEEKFVQDGKEGCPAGEECWMWKNIETLPWDYTEFKLPELPDVPTEPGYTTGDYILVSSWLTEDNVRMKFVYDAEAGMVNSADIYVQDAVYNAQYHPDMPTECKDSASLRIYGRCNKQAAFPYTDYRGPFVISDAELADPDKAPQIPPKDFVVFNPAFLDNNDPNAHEQFGDFFKHIEADGDACEKVHLRTWYVPKRVEPRGATYPTVTAKIKTADIVNEYTYILLNPNSLDPTHGSANHTKMVFPMAGLGGQIGLDRYDVNGDRTPEIMNIEEIGDVSEKTTLGEITVSPKETVPGGMDLRFGESIQFFDYMVTLNGFFPGDQVEVGISYIGREYNEPEYIGPARLRVGDSAVVQARYGPVYCPLCPAGPTTPAPVTKPFWVSLEFVGTDYVTLRPHRILTAGDVDGDGTPDGETFFVDGAEYDVAAILIEDMGIAASITDESLGIGDGTKKVFGPVDHDNPGTTLDTRYFADCNNDGAVDVKDVTVYVGTTRVEVDSIDRTAGTVTLKEAPADGAEVTIDYCWANPDELKYITLRNPLPKDIPDNNCPVQIPDITVWKECIAACESLPMLPPFNYTHDMVDDINIPDLVMNDPDGQYGDNPAHDIETGYRYIADRVIRDVKALDGDLLIAWIDEDKEERFDTNLLEEKFIQEIAGEFLGLGDGTETTFGPVFYANRNGTYFADCNGDGVVDKGDVTVYVNGVVVGVESIDQDAGKVTLSTPPAEGGVITIDYCFDAEYWRWKNIETLPWDYTDLVLPKLPDITDPDAGYEADDGDYILVSSFITEDGVRVKFYHDAAFSPYDKTGIYVNTMNTLLGHVAFQGVAAPPAGEELTVEFIQAGEVVDTRTTTIDASGNFIIAGITPGTYDIRVKHFNHLANLESGVVIEEGGKTEVDFGTLLAGDANNDNAVHIDDFTILASTFLTAGPEADFNFDGLVNIDDFELLRANFGQEGA